ncbi:hypothetical protein Leryth_025518 [Lithospermum erythrorhizon]|nr:hypothetical protein Leryth_025518 [Lithospermum erythrorhizon]
MIIGAAAISTGIGLQSSWKPKKLVYNFGTKIPKWIIPPNPASSTSRITKMTAFVYQKHKSEEAFNKDKARNNLAESIFVRTNDGLTDTVLKEAKSD